MQKKYAFGGLGLLLHLTSLSQTIGTLDGTVQNSKGILLPGAVVVVKGTYLVDGTDKKGQFHLKGNFAQPIVLVVSYVGYETQEFPYKPERSTIPITLIPTQELSEVIVAASRVEENLGQVPVTVDKLNARQVANITTPDVVTGLSRLQGVDVSSSSMLNGSFTTRGFNSTGGERVVQLADYFPTVSPGLSTTVGNLNGLPTLDLASIEIVHGASSALYGANAFNGVMLLNSKNPFLDQGLTVRLRGGTRNLLDGQLRYAVKLGERVAFKISGGALQADDFVASNQDPTVLSLQPANNPAGSPLGYDAVSRYGDLGYTYSGASPTGKALVGKTVFLPGFSEADLLQNDTKAHNYKVSPSVAVLLSNNVKITATYLYTNYAGIFQNGARYAIKNAGSHQGRLSVEGSNWVIRGFLNREFSGRNNSLDDGSYNLALLGNYLQSQPVVDLTTGTTLPYTYAQRYFATYGAAYDQAIAAGSTPDAAAQAAHNAAATSAPLLQPGTDAFNRARTQIINNATPGQGAHVLTRSSLAEASGQYHFPTKVVNLLVGGGYRWYILNTDGSLYEDEKDAPLHNYEYGGYGQGSKSFFNNRLKLAAAGRLDYFKNFGAALSPRGSVVYSAGENRQHNFRASYSRAFRSPTQSDQYVRLEQNTFIALGNVRNGYTGYQTDVIARLPGILLPGQEAELAKYVVNIPKLKLEQVNTFEAGYRAQLTAKLSLDAEYYYNFYNNFIGTKVLIANTDGTPTTAAQLVASAATGFQNSTRIIAVSANVDQRVSSQGAGLTLTYTVLPTLTLNGNYSYTQLLTKELLTNTFSFFNAPEHKFNLGFDARPLNSRLDLNVNYRWNSSYYYEATFATGTLPVGQSFDAQVGYTLPKLHTTLQAGGTNLFNTNNFQAYGAASFGRLAYIGLLFDLPK